MDGDFLKVDRLRMVSGALALLVILCLLNWFAISVYFDRLPATGFAEFTTTRGVAANLDEAGHAQGEYGLLLDVRGLLERSGARP